jgi:FixJ family two-component response regulator
VNPRVLMVDDEPRILAAYARGLRGHAETFLAEGPEAALALIDASPPFDVVVSDLRMPGMSGSAFLAEVRKRSAETSRILLSGVQDFDVAVDAVNEGEIFRFLCKPCDATKLVKAVTDGVRQCELARGERHLLQTTVRECVKLLAELLHVADPIAAAEAERARFLARRTAEKAGLPDPWITETAATLAPIGRALLPGEVVRRARANPAELRPEERAAWDAAPEAAARLVAGVPRLGAAADLMRGAASAATCETLSPPAQALRAALEWARAEAEGRTAAEIRAAFEARPERCSPRITEIVCEVAAETPTWSLNAARPVALVDLHVGQVLAQDVLGKTGALVVPRARELTEPLLERIRQMAYLGGVREPVFVYAPA